MSLEHDAPPSRSNQQSAAAALAVTVFAFAMAYLESAVVVYLRAALGLEPGLIFPLGEPTALGSFAAIEVGRETATIVMLAAVGWLAGRSAIERLAWTAVAFGTWDVFYYVWLWIFSGWPPALDTWDLLFLIPVPWAGPVWAPLAVSVALVGFGMWAGLQVRRGGRVAIGPWQMLGGIAGGVIVVVSFTLQAGEIVAGGLPHDYAWIVFVAGMAVAVVAALSALLPGRNSA